MDKYAGRSGAKFSIISLLLSLLLLVNTDALAIPVQINFEGIISHRGSFVEPTGNFTQGQSISGFWKFESTTPDSDSSSDRGAYAQSGASVFQINIGSSSFQANTAIIQILDNRTLGIGTIDAYDILGRNAMSNIGGLNLGAMQITLRDTVLPLDAISGDALPLIAPNPADFDQINQAQGQITGRYRNDMFFMNLEIKSTSLFTASVPEPGILVLLVIGFLGMLVVKRRLNHVHF